MSIFFTAVLAAPNLELSGGMNSWKIIYGRPPAEGKGAREMSRQLTVPAPSPTHTNA